MNYYQNYNFPVEEDAFIAQDFVEIHMLNSSQHSFAVNLPSANSILDNNLHNMNLTGDQVKLKLKQQSKLNQRLHNTKHISKIKSDSAIDNFDNDNIVYCRINNSNNNKNNNIKSDAVMASIFIDKSEIKNYIYKKQQTLYQYLILNNKKYLPIAKKKDHLIFNSNFQSANLLFAFKVQQYQYDLILQNDLNSFGYTQWFYFSVENMKINQTYKFNIINFTKRSSLFNHGLIPLVFSQKLKNLGWERKGFNVKYYQNNTTVQSHPSQNYFTLSWQFETTTRDDKIYFAHSYPYTYQQLNTYIKSITNIPHIYHQTLILTQLKIPCPVITIKNQSASKKSCIFIIARQHPGETPSSFVVQGIINYFKSEKEQIKSFLEQYQLKIIPMVNIDGVVVGNYRCGLNGYDINRKWNNSKDPMILAIKQLIMKVKIKMEIKLFLDLHGHSRKNHSFFFGNVKFNDPRESRKLPYLSSRINSDIKFQQCSFSYDNSKKNTARIALSEFINGQSYTFQASLCGRIKNEKLEFFKPDDYRKLGHDIIAGVYETINYEKIINKPKYIQTVKKLKALDNPTLIKMGQNNSQSSQSDKQSRNSSLQNTINYKRLLSKNRIKISSLIYQSKTAQNTQQKNMFKSNIEELKNNNLLNQGQGNKLNVKLFQFSQERKKKNNLRKRLISNKNKTQLQTKLTNSRNKGISTKTFDMNIQYLFNCTSFNIKTQANQRKLREDSYLNHLKTTSREKYSTESFLLSKSMIKPKTIQANIRNSKKQISLQYSTLQNYKPKFQSIQQI